MAAEGSSASFSLRAREVLLRKVWSVKGQALSALALRRSFQPKQVVKLCSLVVCLSLICGSSLWSQEVKYSRVAEPAEHDHWVVSIDGIPAIVLRSRAGFADPESRARHTTEHLQEAFGELWATLDGDQQPLAGFVVEDCAGNPCIYLMGTEIVLVTPGDAVGYERRDPHHHERHINSRLVAEYWRALLQDIALLLNGQEITTLREFSEARILAHISAEATKKKAKTRSENAVGEIINSLDTAERRELQQLVMRIPRRFRIPTEISQIQPWQAIQSGPVPEGPAPPEGEERPPSPNGAFQKFLGVLLLLGMVTGLYLLGRRVLGARALSVTLILKVDGQESERATFILEPRQEISFEETGGDSQWPIGSPERLRHVDGKLYLRRPDDANPERLVAGTEFKLSRGLGGASSIRIGEIKRA